jgi:hypothetical protein
MVTAEGRMRGVGFLLLGAVACTGKDKDDGTQAGNDCDSIETAPLAQVEATQWPAGLTDAIPVYNDLGGRWTASNSCGEPIAIKFVTRPQEELEVVQTPYNTTERCGCPTDPKYLDDTQYDVVALHDNFDFFVEVFDDPGLAGQTIKAAGALYGPGEPMTVRACGVDDVDPILQSAYDQVTTILRVEGGAMTGSLVLAPAEGEPVVCDLSDFVLVEAQQ